MKTLLNSVLGVMIFLLAIQNSFGQISPHFIDPTFHNFVKAKFPNCVVNGVIDPNCSEIKNCTRLEITKNHIYYLTGIEYFQNLQELSIVQEDMPTIPPLPSTLQKLRIEGNWGLTNIQAFPSGVKDLTINNNPYLTTIPDLPSQLTTLVMIKSHNLISIPALPNTLKFLYFNFINAPFSQSFPTGLEELHLHNIDQMPSVSAFPVTLHTLTLDGLSITSIPALPANLKKFNFYRTENVSSLPILPSTLEHFALGTCPQVTSLPALPNSIKYLYVVDNNISTIPNFPSELEDLDLHNTTLTTIPSLPGKVRFMNIMSTNLTCLPFLPASLTQLLADYGPGHIECLPNLPTPMSGYPELIALPFCETGTTTCPVYPYLSGTAYVDANKNGIKESTENGYGSVKLLIQPTGEIVTTDKNGNYKYSVPQSGNYTITVQSTIPHFTSSPASHSANPAISTPPINDLNNDFALSSTSSISDIEIELTAKDRLRAGRVTGYLISFKNFGTQTIPSGQITLDYDTKLTGVPITTPNSSIAGKYTWNYSSLKPGEMREIEVNFTPPTTTAPGEEFTFSASAPLSNDLNPANNNSAVTTIVTASYDPNDKAVSPEGDLTIADIAAQKPLTYTIRFQNKGNDYAFDVRVIDEISEDLDINTLQTIQTSHPATLQISNGKATWIFKDINLDWESNNEPASHGFIKFKILPKTGLPIGTQITNNANIYFDYNYPITTNTTVNQVAPCGISNATYNSSICAGHNLSVNYTVPSCASFVAGNTFTAQLSDPSGNFSNPINIGTRNATTSGTITTSIPTNIQVGNNYRIRIISSNPALTYTSKNKLAISNNCGSISFSTFKLINVPHNTAYNFGSGDFTIESILIPVPAGQRLCLISKRDPATNKGFSLFIQDQKIVLFINGTYIESANFPSILATCTHIAVTRNSGVITFYLNGSPVGTAINNSDINTAQNIIIGKDPKDGNSLMGIVDEIKMWSIARTQTEINNNKFVLVNPNSTGLIAYWDMNEGAGQIIFDNSLKVNNGYLGDTTAIDANDPARGISSCYTPSLQTGLTFDGFDDRTIAPHHTNYNFGSGDFTIEAWVKLNAASKNYIISKRQTAPFPGFMFITYNYGAKLLLQVNGVNYVSQTIPTIHDNQCHHVAVVKTGLGTTFYVDGVPVGTNGKPGSITSTQNVYIGYDPIDNISTNGTINEVRVWNIAKEATDLYASRGLVYTATTPNLIANYLFKEPSGQAVQDLSITANNAYLGTLSAAADAQDPTRTNTSCFSADRVSNVLEEAYTEEEDTSSHVEAMKIYPNPFKDNAFLVIKSNSKQSFDIVITDITGKEYYRALVATNEENEIGSNLPVGVYIVQVLSNDQPRSYKIVKIK